jgi:hypothetical protein
VSSTAFDPFFELFNSERALAGNDDISTTDLTALARVILPAGTYQASASSAILQQQTGAYTISATAAPESAAGCLNTFVVPGVSTSQSMAATDCLDSNGAQTFYTDIFQIVMVAGRTYTITMTATTAFDPFLLLVNSAGTIVVNDDQSTGTTAQAVFTPGTTAPVFIAASTEVPFVTGTYTLTVAVSAGGAARPTTPIMARPRFEGSQLSKLVRVPKLGRIE